MKRRYLAILCTLVLALAACGDDDDNGGSSSSNNSTENGGGSASEDANGLGVVAENTGSGDFDVNGAGDVTFCYADSGCESFSGDSFNTVFEGQQMEIEHSEADREAVGLEMTFDIDEGTGVLHVVDGRSYEDDGWPEFDIGDILQTSEELNEGDTYTVTWGEVD